MKKWEILTKVNPPVSGQKSNITTAEVVNILLKNRGIKTKEEIDNFLNPKLSDVTLKSVKIDVSQVKKTIARINKAIKDKEQVIVFGDYDVDGICGTAILWETLNDMGARVMPYIPNRLDEGYGLSEKGILNLQTKISDVKLIITVDNGIVANKAVEFARKQGIEVIITDHHVPSEQLPKAFSIVHTTLLCGTGVAYMLSQELQAKENDYLGLVALATVSDLVPLFGANRTLLKYGLLSLQKTKRPGLLALFRESKINSEIIGVYEIGHIIAPRLNAMGRLESAMDSLRLVCTTNKQRAGELADLLASTNKERQNVTEESVAHAKAKVRASKFEKDKLLFIADESYEQGVIGLVAGRLVEEFYIPSIVISKGEIYSKASARSISGFNIIEFIRTELELLVDVGGHPMAAGFTVETARLSELEKKLKQKAEEILNEDQLKRSLKIDLELSSEFITQDLYDAIQKLQPFGMKNPEPTFMSKNFVINDFRLVGNGNKHLKLKLQLSDSSITMDAIAFGMGLENSFKVGDSVDVVYNLDENEWNGNKKLQLKIKDIMI